MKKIVAIMVALLMLVASVASAESAFIISDPVVTVNMGGDMVIDLTGLELCIAGGELDGMPAGQIDIIGDGAKLMGIAFNITGDKLVFAVEGVSGTYYVPLEEVMSGVNQLSSMDLSSVDIDTDALMNAVMSGVEFDGENFRIPYTTVNDVLEILAPALKDVEIPGVDISELTDAIAELKGSDSGITLEGSYSESEAGMAASLDVIPVQNGQAGEVALKVRVEMGDAFAFAAEIPGQMTVYFKGAPTEDGAVAFSVGGEMSGTSFDLSATAAMTDVDVTFATLDAINAKNVLEMTEAEQQQVLAELYGAAGNLISYIYGALGMGAAA